jgi:hypothetical protein
MLNKISNFILRKKETQKVIQFSPPRTGSTLVWNALKLYVNDPYKTHLVKDVHKVSKSLIVSTIRNPFDMVCSSILRYERAFNEQSVQETIQMFESYNFNILLSLTEKKNCLILKYESFYNNYDFLFSELNYFFNKSISTREILSFKNEFSVNRVLEKVSHLKKFGNYNQENLFHGKHIGPNNGVPKSYEKYLNEDMKNQIKKSFKDIFYYFEYN